MKPADRVVANELASSNSTANAFLGGRSLPSWITNAPQASGAHSRKRPATSKPTQKAPRRAPQPPKPTSLHPATPTDAASPQEPAPPAQPSPSTAVPSNVLPSPAPSDELSAERGASITSLTNDETNPRARQTRKRQRISDGNRRVSAASALSHDTMPSISASRSKGGNGVTRQLNVGSEASTSADQMNVANAPSAPVNSAPQAGPPAQVNGQTASDFSYPAGLCLAKMNELRSRFASTGALMNDSEGKRIDLIGRAAQINDYSYLAFHQLLCLYLTNRDHLPPEILQLEGSQQAFQFLGTMLANVSRLRYDIVAALASFPVPISELERHWPRAWNNQIALFKTFVVRLRDGWSGLQRVSQHRNYPIMVPEYIFGLGITSPLLQHIVNRSLVQHCWLGDQGESPLFTAEADRLFIAHQQRFSMLKASNGRESPSNEDITRECRQFSSEFGRLYDTFPSLARDHPIQPRPIPDFHPANHYPPQGQQAILPSQNNAPRPPQQAGFPGPGPQVQRNTTDFPRPPLSRPNTAPAPPRMQQFQHRPVMQAPRTTMQMTPMQLPLIGVPQQTPTYQQPISNNMIQLVPLLVNNGNPVHPQASLAPQSPMSNTMVQPPLRPAVNRTLVPRQPPQDRPFPAVNTVDQVPVRPVHNGTPASQRSLQGPPQSRSELFIPPIGAPLMQRVPPDPTITALHQAHLRSPIMRSMLNIDEPDFGGKLYQHVEGFALPPTKMPRDAVLQYLSFTASATQRGAIPRDECAAVGQRPTRTVFETTKMYRLRCVKTPTPVDECTWVTSDTVWPKGLFLRFNNKSLEARRRLHHGKDLPIDLTPYLRVGENKLEISILRQGDIEPISNYAMAIEVVGVKLHETIKMECLTAQRLPAEEVLTSIKASLNAHSDDDDIAIVNDHISINLFDPFSSCRIFDVPVRGNSCLHRDCFDLQTYLETRPRKGQNTPCDVDVWKCPICKADARPKSLIVDGFLVEVRAKLAEQGLMDTRAIIIESDGSWKPKPEKKTQDQDDDRDDHELQYAMTPSPTLEGGVPLIGRSQQPSAMVHEIIELDSDSGSD